MHKVGEGDVILVKGELHIEQNFCGELYSKTQAQTQAQTQLNEQCKRAFNEEDCWHRNTDRKQRPGRLTW